MKIEPLIKKLKLQFKEPEDQFDGRVDIRRWSLETVDKWRALFEEAILGGVQEVLEIAVRDEDGVSAFFNRGSPDPKDPKKNSITRIMVELPLGNDEDTFPSWTFDLSDLITENIVENDIWDEDEVGELADALRSLADILDKRRADLIEERTSPTRPGGTFTSIEDELNRPAEDE